MSDKHFGDTELGEAIGIALVLLSVLLGVGGCHALLAM